GSRSHRRSSAAAHPRSSPFPYTTLFRSYVPHPFDRLHSIPSAKTLKANLEELDVLEVYNARLLFEAYNDEALRFARKYGLTMGADRKSTRLNSSHLGISYAVFCLKKNKQ